MVNLSKSFLIILANYSNAFARMVSAYFSYSQFFECKFLFRWAIGKWFSRSSNDECKSDFGFAAKSSDYFVSALISDLLELKHSKSNKIFCFYNMRKYFPLAYIRQYVYYTAMLSVTFHNNLVDSVTILGWGGRSQMSETHNILFNLYFENQCFFLVFNIWQIYSESFLLIIYFRPSSL